MLCALVIYCSYSLCGALAIKPLAFFTEIRKATPDSESADSLMKKYGQEDNLINPWGLSVVLLCIYKKN